MKKFLFLLVSVLFSVSVFADQFVIFDATEVPQAKIAATPGEAFTLKAGEIIVFDGANPEGVFTAILVQEGWSGKIMSDAEAETYLHSSTTFIPDGVADLGSDGELYTFWTIDGRYIPASTVNSGMYSGNIIVAKSVTSGKVIKFIINR